MTIEELKKEIEKTLNQVALIKSHNYEGIIVEPKYIEGVNDICEKLLAKINNRKEE